MSSMVFGGTQRQTCTSANLLEFETAAVKGKMSYRSALTCNVINFDRRSENEQRWFRNPTNDHHFSLQHSLCLHSCSIHIWYKI